ncbi:MAG: hypothetical protein ACTSXO_03090 [Candidatus Heimdallarchaeota archaeon]
MAEKKVTEKSSASLNGESDLEGKMIIDSTGATVGKCKAVEIDEKGQIGLVFEVEINGKTVVPVKTIPYSAIGKITDVIELRTPLNIKIAHSAAELKGETTIKADEKEQSKPKEEIVTKSATEEVEKEKIKELEIKDSSEDHPLEVSVNETETKVETPQADPTEQLSKALEGLHETEEETEETKELEVTTQPKEEEKGEKFTLPLVNQLMEGLEESIKKLDKLFNLLSNGTPEEKIETIKALTSLAELSPELGLSLLPKMMQLSDEQHQEVRLAVAQELQVLAEKQPQLFSGYFLEIFENIYDEPIEAIREHLIKILYNIAMKKPEIASEGLEQFFEEVMVGKRVPEVPAKVIHDATLKVVSGNFQLARIAIKVRLKFIAKGGKLASRCAEELEDYNATLIGLAIIESFTFEEAEKLVNSSIFKKLGPIFVEVIQKMISAYKEGSLKQLIEVVDTKIEIPTTVIERFYEIKINKALEGIKNIPIDILLNNKIITSEEAEQIIYRLIVQKKINAAITMNNGKTFITSLDEVINGTKKEQQKSTATKEKAKSTKKTTTRKSTTKKTSPSTSKTKTQKSTTEKKTTETKKQKEQESKRTKTSE